MGEAVQPEYDVVNVDDYGGAIKAMSLLFEYEHTRIAFFSGLMEALSSKRRYDAWDRNLLFVVQLIIFGVILRNQEIFYSTM